jgi:hypothetical protein
MATRRKYRDGGAVNPDNHISADVAAPVVHEVRPAPSDDDDPVKSGLEAIKRAEELHRQHAYADHAEKVDQFAGLSDWKKDFLKQNPILTLPHVATVAQKIYQAGIASGLADDSDELGNFVLEKTSAELRRQREMRERMPAPESEHRRRLADELEREAEQIAATAPPAAPKQAPTSQRSMPISAPVSRAMPSMTSGAMPTRITLSPEQIQIARTAYSAPDMTDAQKEKAYAMNLLKMERMRKAGTLNE